MSIFARVPLEKVIPHMQENGKRELVWYGVTIGQIGFGILVSVKRIKPCSHNWLVSTNPGVCVLFAEKKCNGIMSKTKKE